MKISLKWLGDYVDINSNLGSNTFPDWTISSWFKTSMASMGTLVKRGGGDRPWFFVNYGRLVMSVWNGSDQFTVSSGDIRPADGEWHHAAGVGGSGGMKLYLDGSEVDTDDYTGTWQDMAGDWFIGSASGTASYWNGTLDEVIIYDRALAAAEILQIYEAQSQ